MIELVLADEIYQHGSEHAGNRPRREQAAVNGADHARAEQIGKICGDGGEAAAVHREDDAEEADEQRKIAGRCRPWDGGVERNAQHEEGVVGRLAPDPVGQRGPENPPQDVEQGQQAGEGGAERGDLALLRGIELIEGRADTDQAAAEHFLQQRGGEGKDADTGRDVQAQHPPRQPELRRPPRNIQPHVVLSCKGAGYRGGRSPLRRLPAVGRQPVAERAGHHEHEVDGGQC